MPLPLRVLLPSAIHSGSGFTALELHVLLQLNTLVVTTGREIPKAGHPGHDEGGAVGLSPCPTTTKADDTQTAEPTLCIKRFHEVEGMSMYVRTKQG